MNRRNFIGNLLAAGAGFFVLPPAVGGRIWKATPKVYGWTCYSKELLIQTGIDVEKFIADDAMKMIALYWDRLTINGTLCN
jgi:hypothetical protein